MGADLSRWLTDGNERWAFLILTTLLVYEAIPFVFRITRFLVLALPFAQGSPETTKSPWPRYFSHREWVGVFFLVNSAVFIVSMWTVEQGDAIDAFYGNLLVTMQTALSFLAIKFVQKPGVESGRGIATPSKGTWVSLTVALACMLIANVFATRDSLAKFFGDEIGVYKFIIWMLLDVGALAFIAYLLWGVIWKGRICQSDQSTPYTYVLAERMAWLWAIGLPLLVLVVVDLVLPPDA